MKHLLDIITITKDDLEGAWNNVNSTRSLRERLPQTVGQVVVDSSRAETGEELKSLLSKERSVRYLWQSPSGIAPAFNFGLREARGEWLWFLNGRDEVHPSLDPEILIGILQQTRADVVIFEMEFMQSGVRYKHPPLHDLWPPVYNWIPHPATAIRKKVFERYGPFDEKYRIAMDGEFWFRSLAEDVVVDLVSIPIAIYDENGISSSDRRGTAAEVSSIQRRYLLKLLRGWLGQGQKIYSAFRHFKKLSKLPRS